jgi:hypothetical protein
MFLDGGTFVGTNFAGFHNTGAITGFGTLNSGRLNGTGGANQEIINLGSIIATNGALLLNPGDAFASGGFSNAASATVTVASGATLAINRTANAWNNLGVAGNTNPQNLGVITLAGGTIALYSDGSADAARFVDNRSTITGFGTISGSITNTGLIIADGGTLTLGGTGRFRQAGTLQVNAASTMVVSNGAIGLVPIENVGTIAMNGGTLQSGNVTNSNVIFGHGTITALVFNNGSVLASNGTLWTQLGSFTNANILGTLSTNAVLDIQVPGGLAQPLINTATITMQGGSLIFGGSTSGSISNRPGGVITGVGNVVPTVVNNGTIVAANPISGLSVFSVSLSEFNDGTIGASNNATLNVVISGGAGTTFANNGSISMIGGTLIISNGAPGTITNNFMVSGVGTITPAIHNLGTVAATVNSGVLDVRLLGGTNTAAGRLLAGQGATLQFQGPVANLGTIAPNGLNGGTVQMGISSGIITNRGTGVITANASASSTLAFNNLVANVDGGTIIATNGILAFNAVGGLYNSNATIRIDNTGTLQSNSSNAWANAGTIMMLGGTLRTGGFTNTLDGEPFTNRITGTIAGYGTIIGGGAYGGSGVGYEKAIVNIGTIIATNPLSGAATTLYINTAGATVGDGIRNIGTIIVSSNHVLSLNRSGSLPIVNAGLIAMRDGILTNHTGSGVLTNTGTLNGYGTISMMVHNRNGGVIDATNGLLVIHAGVLVNTGATIRVQNAATLQYNGSNAWANAGQIQMFGGTLRTGGDTNVSFGESFTNSATGVMAGYGTIIGGGAYGGAGTGYDKGIVNLGTIIATNFLASAGTLTINTGIATTNDAIHNLGTMIVASNNTLELRRNGGQPIVNRGTISVRGGTLTASGLMTNTTTGRMLGYGTIMPSLYNSGTLLGTSKNAPLVLNGATVFNSSSGTLGASNGSLIVNTVFTNAGTVAFKSGVGTFNSSVVNENAWTMNPSTNIFNDTVTITSSGYLTMLAGSVNIFKSDFVNQSTQSNLYNTGQGKFLFDAGINVTQNFFVAGLDLGGYDGFPNGPLSVSNSWTSLDGVLWGYTNNFALGTLEVGTNSSLVLQDTFGTVSGTDGKTAGLYVTSLILDSSSLLIVSNNVELYFRFTNGVTGVSFGPTLNPGDNVWVLDGGSFHQINVVPEPSVLMLLTIGASAIYWRRRRKQSLR